MKEEKELLLELMKRYLEIKRAEERMVEEQKNSPGCIVKKGAQKQYSYWQRRVDGKVIQEYIQPGKIEEIEEKIQIGNWKKEKIKEYRQYLATLKKMLRSIGIKEETIFQEYEKECQIKKQEEAQQLAAKEEAEKKRYSENYKHFTDKGEQVASKSELIIANLLYSYGVPYEYERTLTIENISYKPDFTIWKPDGTMIFWEHAGLMDHPEYARKFENKLLQYQKIGIIQTKNLIVTYEKNGSFSAVEVRRMMELYKLI